MIPVNARPKHPLLVLDWNAVQKAPSGVAIPNYWSLLIPNAAAHEAIDKTVLERINGEEKIDGGISAVEALKKLSAFVELHKDRVWIGRDWGLVLFTPRSRRVSMRDLAYRRRDLDFEQPASWVGLVNAARGSDHHRQYGNGIDWFDTMTGNLRQTASPNEKNELQRDENIFARLHDHRFIARIYSNPASNDVIHKLLTKEPPYNQPRGRWWRIVACYAMFRTRLQPETPGDKRFLNNYEDGLSILQGSFTGHLLTNDSMQRQIAEAIAPGIRVWKWSTESPPRLIRWIKDN